MKEEESIVIDVVINDKSSQAGIDAVEDKAKALSSKTLKLKLFDFEEMKKQGSSSLDDLTGDMAKFGLAGIAAGAAVFGMKKLMDFAEQGEHIKAIHAQFELLAVAANVVPKDLADGLEKASDKMMSMEALLKTASSALVNLGEDAARLPQVLELARKVTAVMGGDITERFDGIVNAIESGNAKALKAQGIIIDADKALRTYANGLGIATSELNQTQKQQAIMNAVLTEGSEKFKNADTSIQPLHDNFRRISTAIGDIADNVKKTISNSGVFQAITDKLVEISRGAPSSRGGLATEVADLIVKKAALEKQIAYLSTHLGVNPEHTREVIKELKGKVLDINQAIAQSGAIITQNSTAMAAEAKKAAAAENVVVQAKKQGLDASQQAAVRLRQITLEQVKLQSQLNNSSVQESRLALIQSEADRRLELLKILSDRESLIEQDKNLKIQEIYQKRAANQIQTDLDMYAQIEIVRNQAAQAEAMLQLQRTQAMMEFTATATEGISGYEAAFSGFTEVMSGAKDAAKDFAVTAAANFRNIGRQMFTSIGSGAAQAFAAFGSAIVTGENALESFLNSLIASMGQMAIQLGTQFILQGAAYMWAGLPNGGALMAAGAALAAFGGVLAAVGGGPSTSGGGVSSKPDSETTKVITPEKLEREKPQTNVTVVVQGDVFDTDATGLRIADILSEQYQKNGVKVMG